MQYYTTEELDAMHVGKTLPDLYEKHWEKLSDGTWRWTHTNNSGEPSGDLANLFPKSLSEDITLSKPTFPTPTLGELAALRESYRGTLDSIPRGLGSERELVQARIDDLDDVIAKRFGWDS